MKVPSLASWCAWDHRITRRGTRIIELSLHHLWHIVEHFLDHSEEILHLIISLHIQNPALMSHNIHNRLNANDRIIFIFILDEVEEEVEHLEGVGFECIWRIGWETVEDLEDAIA